MCEGLRYKLQLTIMLGHVMTPMPESLVKEHFGGTCPQFNLQEIKGTGTPTASHLSISVSPGFSFTFEGFGGLVTCTGTIKKKIYFRFIN